MKTAFAQWDNRIAPVFDTARFLHVIEAESGRVLDERSETLSEEAPLQRVLRMVDLGIKTLVCGAISRPFQELVSSYGIKVMPFVAGELREVIDAWLSGTLERDIFIMPGCCGRLRRRHGETAGGSRKELPMNVRGRGNGNCRGTGQGQGKGLGGGGNCVCPQCGLKEPHEQGVPCVKRTCPNCGIPMVREQQ